MSHHLAKDIHAFTTQLGYVVVGLAQVAYYGTVFAVEGVTWLCGAEAPDRSNEVPVEARVIDGRPVVRWLADEGNEFGESASGYSVYEAVVTFQYHATIDDHGRLVVMRQPLYGEYRWKPYDGSYAEISKEGFWSTPEPEIQILCDLPADELTGFTPESTMGDLDTWAAQGVRTNRQWYTEHQAVRATFKGGQSGILSVCQRGHNHTRRVIFELTRMFAGAKSTRALPAEKPPLVSI